jgi:hypothetical protein
MKTRNIGDLIGGSGSAQEDKDGHDETLFELAGSKTKLFKRLFEIPQKWPEADMNVGNWMAKR